MSVRPPVKWYGGKRYLASRIIDKFPAHRIYLEPFGGGASVLLNKPPVEVETYNDLDLRISRLEFEAAAKYPEGADELEQAVCDFVRWRQSFGGKGKNWSYTTGRARGGMAGDVNAWWTAIDMLPQIIDRLRRVQIICQSAFEAIPRFDHEEALIYCDPPYVHQTRAKGSTAVYGVEMTDDQHRELAAMLSKCKAKVVLSGYPSPLYEELYEGWKRVEFDIANHAAGGKTKARERECLWMNF
jgi:DNA adenine methylase